MSDDQGQVWPGPADQDSAAQTPAGQEIPDNPVTTEPLFVGQGDHFGVTKCAACDGRHEDIKLTPYTRQAGPFTHWYACPNLGDPVPITLMTMTDGEGIELHAPTVQSLAKGMISGRFMAVIFYIHNGQLMMDRHTWKFPPADYFEQGPKSKGAIKMLEESCRAEAGPQQPSAIRDAIVPKPLRTLSGTAGPLPNQQRIQLPPIQGTAQN